MYNNFSYSVTDAALFKKFVEKEIGLEYEVEEGLVTVFEASESENLKMKEFIKKKGIRGEGNDFG
jgi:hypothetical protein